MILEAKDKMRNYTYVAILQYDADGISVFFPDIAEAYTCALTAEEALKDAAQVLKLSLRSRIKDGEVIPEPEDIRKIIIKENQYTTFITASLDNENKYDKKTLTLPHSLNTAAVKAGINFSKVLQAALKVELVSLDSSS